jgi:uncharacterized protein YndB with AHSA1/START domain
MQTVTVERVVAAPVTLVFEWLSDASNYPRSWIVVRQRLVRPGEGTPYGLDAVRSLTWLFGWFRERITTFRPPHEFSYVVERSVPPLRHEGGRVRLSEVDGGTRIVWTTTVELRVPVAADALTRLLGRRMIRLGFGSILAAADKALRA